MIILCRFFLLSHHKTFLPLYHMPHMLSWRKKQRIMEMVRVRSCYAGAFELMLVVESALESSSFSSDTYFFHHINNISRSIKKCSHATHINACPPRQTHMKWGWIGNYYVVNITHPTACIVWMRQAQNTVMNMFVHLVWVTRWLYWNSSSHQLKLLSFLESLFTLSSPHKPHHYTIAVFSQMRCDFPALIICVLRFWVFQRKLIFRAILGSVLRECVSRFVDGERLKSDFSAG